MEEFGPGKSIHGWQWEEWQKFKERLLKLSRKDLEWLVDRHRIKFSPGYVPTEQMAYVLIETFDKQMLIKDVEEIEKRMMENKK